MRRRRLIAAAALAALLGWLLWPSGDPADSSGSRRFAEGEGDEAGAGKFSIRGAKRGRQGGGQGEGLEVAREDGESLRPGSTVSQMRWRNESEPTGDKSRGPSKKVTFRGVEAIDLDSLGTLGEADSVELTGEDPLAPRKLIAWRSRHGEHSVLARGWSDDQGVMHFPPILVPQNGLKVTVTDASSVPGAPGSSVTHRLSGRLPEAAQARLIDFVDGEYWFQIIPIEGVGTVLLADANGATFATYDVAPVPDRASRSFDVGIRSPGGYFMIGHEFSDGRTSEWEAVELRLPEVAAAGS